MKDLELDTFDHIWDSVYYSIRHLYTNSVIGSLKTSVENSISDYVWGTVWDCTINPIHLHMREAIENLNK